MISANAISSGSAVKVQDDASQAYFQSAYDELKRIAHCQMGRERSNHTLQPTALVSETYLRLMAGNGQKKWESRGHFLRSAAGVMRHILIDSARRKKSRKREGSAQAVQLSDDLVSQKHFSHDLLAVNEALIKFEKAHGIKAEVVILRFFGGLTMDEISDALSISRATANNYWSFGKAWLFREIQS